MIIIDNNISYHVASILKDDFIGIVHVSSIGLDEVDDSEIWKYAKDKELHIFTKDKDFNDIQQLKGFPPKIVWVRTGNASTKTIVNLLIKEKAVIIAFFKNTTTGILEIQN